MRGDRETGRVVPASEFVKNTVGSLDVIKVLHGTKLKDGITLIDNSLGAGKASIVDIATIESKKIPSNLKSKIDSITNKIHAEGKITDRQRNALLK